jgi:hypothetical protein
MRAIVNVGVGGWYPAGQRRLRQSLIAMGDKTERIFFHRWPGLPHFECQYGFKVDAFREAQRRGYDQVLWLDAANWVRRPLEPAFEQIERDGYLLGSEGFTVGAWCSEEVRLKTGYTRERLAQMSLPIGNVIGLDLSTTIGAEFLDRWEDARNDGWFNGSWDDHRHDITAAGIIAYEMGLTFTPSLYVTPKDPNPFPDAYCLAAGM